MIRITLIVALLVGCKIKNELSCENPDNADLAHCSNVDAPEACSATDACSAGVCKLPDGICVECLVGDDCPAGMPVCNTSNTCELCDAHTDCDSELCNLASGACIDEAQVVYVAEDGASPTCTKAAPCGTLQEGFEVVDAGTKTFIKLSGEIVSDSLADADNLDFTLFADNGKLGRSTQGTVLSIRNGSDATIFDLEVAGGQAGSDGILVADSGTRLTLERVLVRDHLGRGIVATGGNTLTMRRCIVSANIGGGGNLQGIRVELTNNLIVRNGNNGNNTGGVVLDPMAGSTFTFNTIADNTSLTSANSGVNCINPFTASNNIVTTNAVAASCSMFTFTLVDGSTLVFPSGTGNRLGSPMFVSTDPAMTTEPTYYRIMTGSDAIDRADPGATEAIDIDGQARPAGMADMGADELNL